MQNQVVLLYQKSSSTTYCIKHINTITSFYSNKQIIGFQLIIKKINFKKGNYEKKVFYF